MLVTYPTYRRNALCPLYRLVHRVIQVRIATNCSPFFLFFKFNPFFIYFFFTLVWMISKPILLGSTAVAEANICNIESKLWRQLSMQIRKEHHRLRSEEQNKLKEQFKNLNYTSPSWNFLNSCVITVDFSRVKMDANHFLLFVALDLKEELDLKKYTWLV